ncbi:DUF6875 domain-containing protein [Actinocorallia sp. A-T 12471]|uniref:DUF6875 domain-containing protein n=1 Tax=Actinocorallia sp. A-T 12471 TaxID=3089813 RepID=UPI0029D01547|nr:hypothetical protein [Actinocorallia sp. A-T 12471]MDX6739387.1 hypothetical protein [Actinocorallia sp. A-T 12471]
MITHPRDPALRLLETTDVHVPEAAKVVAWARDYLVNAHPDLGRKGPVCPYAQGSLSRRAFYLHVVPEPVTRLDEITGVAEKYRDWFLELAPRAEPDALFTTILLLFPEVRDLALIDRAQAALRPSFVSRGLMVGEFHDGPPPKGGLWNPEWRPLRSPVPLLGLRHMVPSDRPFLAHDPALLEVHEALFGGARC